MITPGECNGGETLDCDRLAPFRRARSFVWVCLLPFNYGDADVRWTMLFLVLRGLGVVAAFAQRQLAMYVGNVLHRAWRGAHFVASARDADSMVAAGGR